MPTITNPAAVALRSDRYGVWIESPSISSGAKEKFIHLAQSIDPTFRTNLEVANELGSVDVVDSAYSPIEPSVALERYMVGDLLLENLIAAQTLSSTSVDAGDLIQKSNLVVYIPVRDPDDAVLGERKIAGCALSSFDYRFSVDGVVTEAITLEGTTMQVSTTASGTHTFPAGDEDSATHRMIKGRDVELQLGDSDDTPASQKVFRLQSFDIRLAVPTQRILEMGNRSLVGVMTMPPSVTFDFEVLEADLPQSDATNTEVDSVIAAMVGGTLDYETFNTIYGIVNVYDPAGDGSPSGTVLKSFRLAKLRPSTGTLGRSAVRGLATKRFSMQVTGKTTSGTAGLEIQTDAAFAAFVPA